MAFFECKKIIQNRAESFANVSQCAPLTALSRTMLGGINILPVFFGVGESCQPITATDTSFFVFFLSPLDRLALLHFRLIPHPKFKKNEKRKVKELDCDLTIALEDCIICTCVTHAQTLCHGVAEWGWNRLTEMKVLMRGRVELMKL